MTTGWSSGRRGPLPTAMQVFVVNIASCSCANIGLCHGVVTDLSRIWEHRDKFVYAFASQALLSNFVASFTQKIAPSVL